MASQWSCKVLGQEIGPLTFQEMTEMVRAGTLKEADQVRRKGTSEWIPAQDVIGLFRAAKKEPAQAASAAPEPKPPLPPDEPPAKGQPAAPPRRTGKRHVILGAGIVLALVLMVASVSAWRSSRRARFPEPQVAKRRSADKDELAAFLATPPEVPSVPGLEERVPRLVPGLEDIEPVYSPCLSPDLRTIVLARMRPLNGKWDWKNNYDLYMATREDVSQAFGELRRIDGSVFPGTDVNPTLSPDGLELIFDSPENRLPRLYYCKRQTTSGEFGKAVRWSVPGFEPTELQRVERPQFTDPLSVVFVVVSTDGQDRSVWAVTRTAAQSAFGSLREFPVSNPWPAYFVAETGLRAYCGSPTGLSVVGRRNKSDTFGQATPLLDAAVTGVIEGRVWVAPQEDVVFYVSAGPGEKPRSRRRLWMVRL